MGRNSTNRSPNQQRGFLGKINDFFEKNEKAFTVPLQIFSTLVLGVAGVYISFLGWQSNQREKESHEVQMEAFQNNAEPIFTIKSRHIDGETKVNDYSYTRIMHTIVNEGGIITGAYILGVYKNIKVIFFSEKLNKNITYILELDGLFEQTEGLFSMYDEDKKEFIFYERKTSKTEELKDNLKSEIVKILSDSEKSKLTISFKDTIYIEYINYMNKEFSQVYEFMPNNRLIVSPGESIRGDGIFLGSANIDENIDFIVQDIRREIQESINEGGEKIKNPRTPKLNYDFEKEKKNACADVKKYLSKYPSSYDGVLDLLENSWNYYHEVAVYAVNNCNADWNEQAIKKAEDYLHFDPISYEVLIESLEKNEKFTQEQAVYGASNCSADWNEQAKRKAEMYVYDEKSYSRDKLIKQLMSVDKFTYNQAIYGADEINYTN